MPLLHACYTRYPAAATADAHRASSDQLLVPVTKFITLNVGMSIRDSAGNATWNQLGPSIHPPTLSSSSHFYLLLIQTVQVEEA